MTKYRRYQYGVTQINPLVTVHLHNLQTASDSGKILHKQCTIYWQSKCHQMSVESAKANNS